jgi:hypothetical protein
MATENRRDEWQRTAEVMALHANIHRNEGDSIYHPDSFNLSLSESEKRKPLKGKIGELKSLLPEKEQERLRKLDEETKG